MARRVAIMAVVGLALAAGGCASPPLEGEWQCQRVGGGERQLFTLHPGGDYRMAFDDGGWLEGEWAREGDTLRYSALRGRVRVPADQRAAMAQAYALNGDRAALADLIATGFISHRPEHPTTQNVEIERLDDEALVFTLAGIENRGRYTASERRPRTECARVVEPETKPEPEPEPEPEPASDDEPASRGASGTGTPAAVDDGAALKERERAARQAAPAPPAPTAAPPAPTSAPSASDGDGAVAQRCEYSGAPDWASPPVLARRCADTGACRAFAWSFPPRGVVVEAEDMGLDTYEGWLAGQPADPRWLEETVGGATYVRWVLAVLDAGRVRAGELRYRVFDGDGAPLSPLLDAEGLAAWQAARHRPKEALEMLGPYDLQSQCGGMAQAAK